jgi:hypothetical protein
MGKGPVEWAENPDKKPVESGILSTWARCFGSKSMLYLTIVCSDVGNCWHRHGTGPMMPRAGAESGSRPLIEFRWHKLR